MAEKRLFYAYNWRRRQLHLLAVRPDEPCSENQWSVCRERPLCGAASSALRAGVERWPVSERRAEYRPVCAKCLRRAGVRESYTSGTGHYHLEKPAADCLQMQEVPCG